MVSWGMDLAKAPGSVSGGLGTAAPFYVLVAAIVFTGYYQQRQMTARTPASAQNPQMQMMGKIFPIFFGFISLQIPAGVGVYFATSNLWQIGQQAIIFRQQDKAEAGGKAPPKPPDADKAKPTGGDQTKPGDGDKSAPAGPEPSSRGSGNSGGSGVPRSRSRSSPRKRRRRR
jgi:membrane protein insertase Oxa1/YidC/SpoIIIJ